MTYSDQTGWFPYQSSQDIQYIYIVYDYDANAILHAPLTSRKTEHMIAVWEDCYKRLTKKGHKVVLHILDNVISSIMKNSLKINEVQFQLVPPDQHR